MDRMRVLLAIGAVLLGCGTVEIRERRVSPGVLTEDSGAPAARDGGEAREAGTDAGDRDAGTRVRLTVSRRAVDAGTTPVELLILHAPGRAAAYAQWMPAISPDGGPRPAIVVARPYDGVTWSPDPLDRRWTQLGAGAHPDVDGPFAGASPTPVPFPPVSVEAELTEAAIARAHGISTLAIYGRFYAGGSIRDDIDDVVSAFDFLALEPGVDRSRLGISGGSWGGFMAVFGAAAAPSEAAPVVGVASAPVVDFEREWRFATSTMPQRFSGSRRDEAERFFDPYARRIRAATLDAGVLDFSRVDLEAVASSLRTSMLIVHEDWDTLVDFDASLALAQRRPELVHPLWFRHRSAPTSWDDVGLSHGPLTMRLGSSAWPFMWAHLLLPLCEASVVEVPWDEAAMVALLEHARGAPELHHDVARQLLRLTDRRVMLIEASSGAREPGSDVVVRLVNAAWARAETSATIALLLDGGVPR